MKITRYETMIINVPYKRREVSSRLDRAGVSTVLLKLTTDDGIVGWGGDLQQRQCGGFR